VPVFTKNDSYKGTIPSTPEKRGRSGGKEGGAAPFFDRGGGNPYKKEKKKQTSGNDLGREQAKPKGGKELVTEGEGTQWAPKRGLLGEKRGTRGGDGAQGQKKGGA